MLPSSLRTQSELILLSHLRGYLNILKCFVCHIMVPHQQNHIKSFDVSLKHSPANPAHISSHRRTFISFWIWFCNLQCCLHQVNVRGYIFGVYMHCFWRSGTGRPCWQVRMPRNNQVRKKRCLRATPSSEAERKAGLSGRGHSLQRLSGKSSSSWEDSQGSEFRSANTEDRHNRKGFVRAISCTFQVLETVQGVWPFQKCGEICIG